MRRTSFLAGVLASCLAFEGGPLAAEPAPRPRLGLVLSGGAAHGLAHVGVLKVLEELRVPVDVVAGTSMGAIVGGLYASGMSPEEMEKVLGSIDWEDLFDDRPERSTLSYRRKQDDVLNYIDLEMGITRKGIAFPSGLVAGQKLSFLLKTLTLGTVGVERFDDLPIPFRCVATDIASGGKVVLSGGSLAEAIRASMSLPGIFSPVRMADALLVDGGLVDNLPVAEAEGMGAKVLVAVDVSSEKLDPEKLKSFGGILSRTISLPIKENVAAALPRASVVVKPQVGDLPSMDFSRGRELIARGEAAARTASESLARLAVSEEEYRAFRDRVRRRLSTPHTVDAIQTMSSGVDSRQVTSRLETKAGRPLDLAVLRRDLDRIYEMGVFETVDFQLVRDEGKNVLVIDAKPKSWGPTFLRVGTGFESNLSGDATVAVRATVHAMQLDALAGEVKVTAEVGTIPGLAVELYQPLDFRGRLFVDAQAAVTRSLTRVAVTDGPVGEGRVTLTQGSVAAGLALGSWGQVMGGVFRGGGRADVLLSESPLDTIRFDLGGLFARFGLDTLDDRNFPRNGALASAFLASYLPSIGSDADCYQLQLRGLKAFSLGRRTSIHVNAGWEDTLGSNAPFYLQFTLGDFTRLAALSRENAVGERAAFASVSLMQRVASLPTRLGRGVYVGASFEMGRVWAKREDAALTNLRPAGGVLAGADTVLGPIYAGVGVNYGGTSTFYLLLGRPF